MDYWAELSQMWSNVKVAALESQSAAQYTTEFVLRCSVSSKLSVSVLNGANASEITAKIMMAHFP
jgi:hypothetical protein